MTLSYLQVLLGRKERRSFKSNVSCLAWVPPAHVNLVLNRRQRHQGGPGGELGWVWRLWSRQAGRLPGINRRTILPCLPPARAIQIIYSHPISNSLPKHLLWASTGCQAVPTYQGYTINSNVSQETCSLLWTWSSRDLYQDITNYTNVGIYLQLWTESIASIKFSVIRDPKNVKHFVRVWGCCCC